MLYGIYKRIFLIFSETLSKYGFAFAYRLPSNIHPSIVFSDAKGRSVQIGYDYENGSPFGRLYGEKAELPEYSGSKDARVKKQLQEYLDEIDLYFSSKGTKPANRCHPADEEDRMSRARQLFFTNYGNAYNMKKNGEYDEYKKLMVPAATESAWSEELKESLMEKIQSGEDIWHVSTLANLTIDHDEIINCFRRLSSLGNSKEIAEAVMKSEPLFDRQLFQEIMDVMTK